MTARVSPNPVREAMDLTAEVLGVRLARCRVLFLTVGPLLVLPPVLAPVFLSWHCLLGWLLVVPLCGAFLWRDTAHVARWQQHLFGMWVDGGIDLDVLRETMLATPGPAPRLLKGMLDTLPARKGGFVPIPAATRLGVGSVATALTRAHADRAALLAFGLLVALGCVGWAAVIGLWLPLAGVAAVAISAGLARIAFVVRVRRAIRTLPGAEAPGFDPGQFAGLVEQLDWGWAPAVWRQRATASILTRPAAHDARS